MITSLLSDMLNKPKSQNFAYVLVATCGLQIRQPHLWATCGHFYFILLLGSLSANEIDLFQDGSGLKVPFKSNCIKMNLGIKCQFLSTCVKNEIAFSLIFLGPVKYDYYRLINHWVNGFGSLRAHLHMAKNFSSCKIFKKIYKKFAKANQEV